MTASDHFGDQDRYREILERSSDYVLLVDKSGIIEYISPSVEPISGYDPESLVGSDALEHVHPADVDRVRDSFEQKLAQAGAEVTVEYRIETAAGDSKWVEARGANYLEDPVVDGVLVTVREITQRKAYESQLEAQNRLLERLTRIVAHDLRTPVSAAQKLVPILRTELDDSGATATEALDRLAATLETVSDFTEHIPRLAKEGTRVERRQACDLETVARDVWNTVETPHLTLAVPDSRRLEGDPQRIQQVFQNLFENVVNHADPHTAQGATTVTIGTTATGFFVEDDGPGIDGVSTASAFDYGTTTADDGTGIGLAIVRTIVEAHGWDVAVTAGAEGGARFEITVETD